MLLRWMKAQTSQIWLNSQSMCVSTMISRPLPLLKDKYAEKIIFEALREVLQSYDLPWEKLIAVATDGAPAMVGGTHGLAGLIKAINPNVFLYHCIIHQAVLCCKLSEELSVIMETIMKLVNYLRAKSSLQHRL